MYLLYLLVCYKSISTTFLHSHISIYKFPIHSRCTHCKYRAKTGNNISEFTHSNWITKSYYSSPKHKSLLPKYLIHFSHFCIPLLCTGLGEMISLEYQLVTGFFGLELGVQISLTSIFDSYQALKLLNMLGPFFLFPEKDTATKFKNKQLISCQAVYLLKE